MHAEGERESERECVPSMCIASYAHENVRAAHACMYTHLSHLFFHFLFCHRFIFFFPFLVSTPASTVLYIMNEHAHIKNNWENVHVHKYKQMAGWTFAKQNVELISKYTRADRQDIEK